MSLEFDVVDLGPADAPGVGDVAPEFTRPLVDHEHWRDVALADLTDEGPVVLLFHTMDGDFPATYVWQEVRDRGWDEYETTVVGCGISTPYEHSRFLEEWNLEAFRLFSDPANEVAEAYGISHDLDGMEGISEPRPAAFLLDDDRTVRHAWVATEWPEFPPYDELEAAIDSLEP
jgi:peroxiredoxin